MKSALALARAYDMLPGEGSVLVALSGGLDSMCLLHWLRAQGVRVAAAHFNHHLRGAEADADERFVREYCAREGVVCIVGGADVAALARARGEGVEETGRRERYAFLEHAADEAGAERIATAHHANDNAETLLFRLARGTGTGGLGGIAPVRGRIIRPLLTTTRAELEAYARQNDLPYRTDASNGDTAFARNFIRSEVLPRLEKLNPAAVTHMTEAALLARREDAFLDALAAQRMAGLETDGQAASLPLAALSDAPEVLRARMLRLLLSAAGAGKKDVTARHLEALEALVSGSGGTQLDLPHGVSARREGERLLLRVLPVPPPPVLLAAGQETVWGGCTLRMTYVPGRDENRRPDALYLRADAAPLLAGAWDARAFLTLCGRARSLKRLFVEHGVPPETRDRTPVLYSGGRLAAAYGIGVDDAFLPEENGGAWCIEIEKTDKNKERGRSYG